MPETGEGSEGKKENKDHEVMMVLPTRERSAQLQADSSFHFLPRILVFSVGK